MPALRLRFLLDENILGELALLLRAEGHDVLKPPLSISNGSVLALAKRTRRILLTRDKNFADKEKYPPTGSVGVVLFSITSSAPEDFVNAFQMLFRSVKPRNLRNRLVVLERERFEIFK